MAHNNYLNYAQGPLIHSLTNTMSSQKQQLKRPRSIGPDHRFTPANQGNQLGRERCPSNNKVTFSQERKQKSSKLPGWQKNKGKGNCTDLFMTACCSCGFSATVLVPPNRTAEGCQMLAMVALTRLHPSNVVPAPAPAVPAPVVPADVLEDFPEPEFDLQALLEPADVLEDFPEPEFDLQALLEPADVLEDFFEPADVLEDFIGPEFDLQALLEPADVLEDFIGPADDLQALPEPEFDLEDFIGPADDLLPPWCGCLESCSEMCYGILEHVP